MKSKIAAAALLGFVAALVYMKAPEWMGQQAQQAAVEADVTIVDEAEGLEAQTDLDASAQEANTMVHLGGEAAELNQNESENQSTVETVSTNESQTETAATPAVESLIQAAPESQAKSATENLVSAPLAGVVENELPKYQGDGRQPSPRVGRAKMKASQPRSIFESAKMIESPEYSTEGLSDLEKEIVETVARAHVVRDPFPKADAATEEVVDVQVKMALKKGLINKQEVPRYRQYLRQLALAEVEEQQQQAYEKKNAKGPRGLFADGHFVHED